MTLLLGILCTDGVVVAADSAATFNSGQIRTMEQPTHKIHIIDGKVIVAGTGAIGHNQRFCDVVQKLWKDPDFPRKRNLAIAQNGMTPQGASFGSFKDADLVQKGRMMSAAGVVDLQQTGLMMGTFGYGALVAMPVAGSLQLYELDPDKFQPEFKNKDIWYTAMGSGQLIADPLLALMREFFWRAGPPSLQSGLFAATWVMMHAIKINPGGVNEPLEIAVLDSTGARLLSEDDVEEHKGHVADAVRHMREFEARLVGGEGTADAPEAPKPT
jgi:20S proteasome alpha/beta subunit